MSNIPNQTVKLPTAGGIVLTGFVLFLLYRGLQGTELAIPTAVFILVEAVLALSFVLAMIALFRNT